MNTSFYTAARAASTQQERMNIIANNISNVNTPAYKSKSAVFQDLVYYNMREGEEPSTNLTSGVGVKVSHTNTDFTVASALSTDEAHKYAILGEGFFVVQNPINGGVTYTRDGNFILSNRNDGYYLSTDTGKPILDENGALILLLEDGTLSAKPAVYTFDNTDGMLSVSETEFVPIEKNGQPQLVQDAKLLEKHLEMSNVDLATEMANTIETSRAYGYVLKMMQTADEVQETINNLRR